MANQTGIAIVIKAWLPTGKTLDEQFTALSIVKAAHESGDYAALLAASKIEGVQTEQKTRRIEDAPQGQQQPAGEQPGEEGEQEPRIEDNTPAGEPVIEPQTAALKKAMGKAA